MKMYTSLALVLCFIVVAQAIHPVVLFPAYALSKLNVVVTGGTEPDCPTDGQYVIEYLMESTQNNFTLACMMNYMNLTVNLANTEKPFSNRPDVAITIPGRDIGSTECLSAQYDTLTTKLKNNGYTTGTANASFLAACYDWRMTPNKDALEGPSFLNNTLKIVQQAYAAAGNQKVWLIGHSNGPIMALYFLNQLSAAQRDMYIAGFISLSGNFAGQGLLPSVMIQGLSVNDFNFFPPSAGVHSLFPANYMSSPQPAVFKGDKSIVFLKTINPPREFHTNEADFDSFFNLSGNAFGLNHWREYVGLVGPHTPPGVYTYSFWGNNLTTVVGLVIDSFSNVTVIDYLTRNGDVNQEDIDNESVMAWATAMPTGCFDHQVMDNVNHFALSYDQIVTDKIVSLVLSLPNVTCASTQTTTGATATTGGATSGATATTGATTGAPSGPTTGATSGASALLASFAFLIPFFLF